MTDVPSSVGAERCSSHVQRVGRRDVVKSSRTATAVKEVEGKSAFDGIQMLSGGFVTVSRVKGFEMCSVPHSSGESTNH